MANWRTYIGFFQYGEAEATSPDGEIRPIPYYNFYPVMERRDDMFQKSFPNPLFSYGRLQLKRINKEYGTQANIMIEEIDRDLQPNMLTVISFDESKLFASPIDDRYYMGILLDSDDDIKSVIKKERFSFEDIFGSSYHLLVSTDALEPASNYRPGMKTNCALPDNPLAFPSFSCVLQCGQLLSTPVPAKISLGFHKTIPWLDTTTTPIKQLYEFQDGIADGTVLPYWVDPTSWTTDHFAEVREIELVELQHGATPIKGTLDYNSREMLYSLKAAKGAMVASTIRSIARISPQYGLDFLEQTKRFLQESGRDVTKADVINYCICITQGFITTFAGAPGTGKTTLCRLLAQAMGLEEEYGEYDSSARYAEISVERGWTSLRDFIGYPNPFPTAEATATDDIIATNVDACHAFRRMSEKWDTETQDAPPYLMLLDEANLSPIEYYWSQFLRNCQVDDPDELNKRKINISQREAWKLSPNLRFLATVNFDHTTEELSPRFLDRSWVITLQAPARILANTKPTTPKTVPMSELNRLFGHPTEGETFPARLATVWTQIQQAFKGEAVNMPLSPRNILAVEHYCIAAARFSEDEITLEQALDFAVLQKILPTISGYGDRCETLVNQLLEIAQEYRLLRTFQKLTEMNAAANANSQFYQFFVR